MLQFDMTHGYWQVLWMTHTSISAFVTPYAQFQRRYMQYTGE